MSQPIKKGDRVRIVNPQIFVRCGYDYNFNSEVAAVYEELGSKIYAFLESVGLPSHTPSRDKIVNAIAHARLRRKLTRRADRKLYTSEATDYKGIESEVRSVFFVKTGTYLPGSCYSDEEYDPPVLADQKTHRILELDEWHIASFLHIEDIHVVKV